MGGRGRAHGARKERRGISTSLGESPSGRRDPGRGSPTRLPAGDSDLERLTLGSRTPQGDANPPPRTPPSQGGDDEPAWRRSFPPLAKGGFGGVPSGEACERVQAIRSAL